MVMLVYQRVSLSSSPRLDLLRIGDVLPGTVTTVDHAWPTGEQRASNLKTKNHHDRTKMEKRFRKASSLMGKSMVSGSDFLYPKITWNHQQAWLKKRMLLPRSRKPVSLQTGTFALASEWVHGYLMVVDHSDPQKISKSCHQKIYLTIGENTYTGDGYLISNYI